MKLLWNVLQLIQWRFWGIHLGGEGSGVAIIAAWGARTYIDTVDHS